MSRYPDETNYNESMRVRPVGPPLRAVRDGGELSETVLYVLQGLAAVAMALSFAYFAWL